MDNKPKRRLDGDRPVEILLVEDNPADVRFIRMVLERAPLKNNVSVVRDGQEAMDYMEGKGDWKGRDRPRPDLIILDLVMPRLSGFQVLARLKADAAHASVPVVILAGSDHEADIVESYRGGAVAFFSKPIDAGKVHEMLGTFFRK